MRARPTARPAAGGGAVGRPVGRRALVAGLVGLGLVALAGATGGPVIVLALVAAYVALTGLWTLVRGRSWVGRVGRAAGAAFLAVGVVGFAAAGLLVDPGGPGPPGTTTAPPPSGAATPAATSAPTDPHTGAATPAATSAPTGGSHGESPALAAVADLVVKGRAPMTGYERDLFGEGWGDTDGNGCDTRNDILARDLRDVAIRPGTDGCIVASGSLHDPYTGAVIAFVRGEDTSDDVQIDHVVALADAWQKGAQQWDQATRVAFANDPLNLLAVDGEANQAKGAGDTATWLPPNRAFRCEYVARQVAVKVAYHLSVTRAERDAMVRVLTGCPGQGLPAG